MMNNLRTATIYVSPATAERWLAKNTANYRALSADKVSMYARDMKNGEWKNNGETIKFYEDGTLFDGQHRLAGVVKAGVPVLMTVVWGISKDVKICDSGMNRTHFQILKASTVDKRLHNTQIVAMVNRIVSKDLGTRKQASRMMGAKYVIEHESLLAELPSMVEKGGKPVISKNAACFLASYILLRNGIDKKIVSDFFTIVNSGFVDGPVDGTPAIVMRNLLISRRLVTHTNDVFKELYTNALFLLFDFMNQRKRRRPYQFNDMAQAYFEDLLEKDGLKEEENNG